MKVEEVNFFCGSGSNLPNISLRKIFYRYLKMDKVGNSDLMKKGRFYFLIKEKYKVSVRSSVAYTEFTDVVM
jgi:hypothetical protein